MPGTFSSQAIQQADLLEAAKVAEAFIQAAPGAARHRDSLVELARIGWSGQFPIRFYLDIANLLARLPWLVDRWVGQEVVDAISGARPHDPDGELAWEDADPTARKPSTLIQMEGLLLLGRLEAPQEIAAQNQLAALLDAVDGLLVSDLGGTVKRKGRRHPLKDVLGSELGRPQSAEALAQALKTAVDKAWGLYPRVSEFLRSTYLPLLCRQPWSWIPAEGPPSLLGVDQDPESRVSSPPPPIPFEIPRPKLRKFTADDLAGEMALVLQSDSHTEAIKALAPLWRGEHSWHLLEATHRLSHTLAWLRPSLSRRVDLRCLQAAGQALHGKQFRYALERAAKWRQRQSIEPLAPAPPPALLPPPSRDRSWGLLHLRGLLLVGRMHWSPGQRPDNEAALSGLIKKLERGVDVESDGNQQPFEPKQTHPLETILDQLGRLDTQEALAAALESLIPSIYEIDPGAGRLLKDAYLPLLKGEYVEDQPRDRSRTKEGSSTPGHGNRQRTKRQPSLVRRTRIRMPTREKPLEGEPPDEAEPEQSFYRRKDPRKKAISIKDEIQWIQQRSWGSNPLLVRSHIESLSDPEAQMCVDLITKNIGSAIKAGQAGEARTGIIAALMLATGLDSKTLATADSRLSEGVAKIRPVLMLQQGQLNLPVIRPESAFNAEGSPGKTLLEPTASSLKLPLPPTVCQWIESLRVINDDPWQWEPEVLQDLLSTYVAGMEAVICSGISLPRIRNFAQASIRNLTKDTAKTMVLCGSSLGRPETTLFYYNASAQDLEISFKKAVWPVFGDHARESTPINNKNVRVGSQLLVKQSAVRDLARSPSVAMNAPSRHAKAGSSISDHNVLINHILCMLMGVAGHRPTAALHQLMRFDFETDQPAAVFQDKKCDPAHFVRYVPVADLVAEQIDYYVRHLRALAVVHRQNLDTSKRIRAALRGEAPLFFTLDGSGSPLELSFEVWRQTLPDNWQKIPLNWGRTWIASRGREEGIEADHLAITLGHLEAVGYPYSSESPLEPAQLSRQMARPMGKLARRSGWVVRKGLAEKDDPGKTILEAGPLKDWKIERSALKTESSKFKLEQRQALRSQVRSMKERGEQVAYQELQDTLEHEIPTHAELAKLAPRSASKEKDEANDMHVELSIEDVEQIELKVQESSGSDRSLMMAAHNALHRYLKAAQKKLAWSCPVPCPWLSTSSMEPTPFFSGLFRATVHVRAMREAFASIPPVPPSDSVFSESEWAFGIASLALFIYSFESDQDHLRAILDGRNSATTSPTIEDLLLIETNSRIGVSGIRGLAAVAVARLKKRHPNEEVPNPDRLDDVLADMLPDSLVGESKGLLARICATVSVSNLVELSGLARLANDPRAGCVSMTAARQRQFIEEGYGSQETSDAETSAQTTTPLVASRRGPPSTTMKQYNKLRRVLYIGDGPKDFVLTETSLSQANIGSFRTPLLRELEAFISQSDLDPLVACIASYASQLTRHGTPEKSHPAWSTVYGYITTFGADLVGLCGKVDFGKLDADEYLDLYQGVIDRKMSDRVKALAARELANFHAYLERSYGFDSVDFSDLEGAFDLPEHQVDADLVQPQELVHGLRRMARFELPVSDMGEPDEVRLNRQALVFALLLKATGGRHNELAALRFKDLVARHDAIVVFARSTRYRRLKTPAARRIIDCTNKLSRRERRVVSDWIEAEKCRLATSWKKTLPIFGKPGEPKIRVPSVLLRDATLDALSESIGSRSKVHRVRHLVASEDLVDLWMSEDDLDQLRRSRAKVRRFVRPQKPVAVVLPIHVRQKSIRLGHRRNSTTVVNYFHMPWVTLSRAHASIKHYETRHAGAVALGVKIATADKIIQRARPTSADRSSADKAAAWLKSVEGMPQPTPASGLISLPRGNAGLSSVPISARLMDRVLRDLQKGLSPDRAAMLHGLTSVHRDRLLAIGVAIKKRTGFSLLPAGAQEQSSRSARRFQSAAVLGKLLALMDEGGDADKAEILSFSATYMMWANKSRRDEIDWPAPDVNRMVNLLSRLGVEPSHMIRAPSDETGFEKLIVLRRTGKKETMNHLIAWSLTVVHVTAQMREYGDHSDRAVEEKAVD